MSPHLLLKRTLLTALVAGLAGCATSPSVPQAPIGTPEEQIAIRAQQRWDALIAGDFATAYTFLSPGYRQANSVEAYQANFVGANVVWLSASVSSVECESPERCNADLEIEFQIKGGLRGVQELGAKQIIPEVWLSAEDGWYHLPRR